MLRVDVDGAALGSYTPVEPNQIVPSRMRGIDDFYFGFVQIRIFVDDIF